MILINDFIKQMVIFFPEIEEKIENNSLLGLNTIIIEDVIMPNIIELLRKNLEVDKLKEIFEFFERVSNSADEDLLNTFMVTTLEILGNEKQILNIAKKYMGPVTAKLQREADLGLGRMVE